MIALEVYLNGRKVCTAGDEKLQLVTGGVSLIRSSGEPVPAIHFSVNGLAEADASRGLLSWATRRLAAGDRVEIRIVNCKQADKPQIPAPPSIERLF